MKAESNLLIQLNKIPVFLCLQQLNIYSDKTFQVFYILYLHNIWQLYMSTGTGI